MKSENYAAVCISVCVT